MKKALILIFVGLATAAAFVTGAPRIKRWLTYYR